jgi:hypothetical protein
MEIIGIIVLIVISICALYLIIQYAIDNSETAHNIKDIRNILAKELTFDKDKAVSKKNSPDDNFKILDTPFDECPACHAKVSPTDIKCPSCGLYLNNTDNKK